MHQLFQLRPLCCYSMPDSMPEIVSNLFCLCRGSAVPAHKHPEEAEPDSHFHWTTPDDGTQMEFTRDRTAVLQMASEWDLCISGDGLTHLQQIREEAAFIPLAQVSAASTFCMLTYGASTVSSIGACLVCCSLPPQHTISSDMEVSHCGLKLISLCYIMLL